MFLFLLEMDCKTYSPGFAKIPLFVDKLCHEAFLYLENTLNLFWYINQRLTVIILLYCWVFSNCYRRAKSMLIVLLHLTMISV